MERIDMHRLQELVRLHRQGHCGREVARLLQMSPNTERRYRLIFKSVGLFNDTSTKLPELDELHVLVKEHLPKREPPHQGSSVSAWEPAIKQMLANGGTPTAIYDYFRLQEPTFNGSLSAIKRLCKRISVVNGPSPQDVAIPVTTIAGDVAQVDFGSIGKRFDPETKTLRKAHVFVMVLGFSRHMFAKIVFDQKIDTWLALHVEAFEFLGGVPQTLVPDNLKSAVLQASFGQQQDAVLNRSYRELARHFGFKIDPTPPRSPQKKGKVESGVSYVKHNFFRPRADERDVGKLSEQLTTWVLEIAGMRKHGTTHKRPLEHFETEEKQHLGALPDQPWIPVVWRTPKLQRDAHVLIDGARYSAPWRLLHKKLLARMVGNSIELYYEDARIAVHTRQPAGGRSTFDIHLPPHRHPYRHRTHEYWNDKARKLGEDVLAYVQEIFESDDVLNQLTKVQGIVCMLEKLPPSRAQAVCRRASFYGAYSYRAIKNIVAKRLDFEPLPTVCMPAGLQTPRFARAAQEILALPVEETQLEN